MSMKIGIFENESQVIEAIQALEMEGFIKTEIKVLAKDREHSQRVESETNVHAEEMNELVDRRGHTNDGPIIGLGVVPPGLAGGMYTMGTLSGVAGPYANGTPLVGAALYEDDDKIEQALVGLGLDNDAASSCRKAIAEGDLAVAADTGDDTDNGGPTLTRSGAAEAALRRSGAKRIL
ncbi:hypothetical protein Back11_35480 [Paenibacillus baekrokdamisoli]|uniref:General stress protein 17M-like domain-containing protein n=1 Tax=Paenibacillus baekrokdamisoli TaxID=1712516 RepID=A0A3G9JBB5_9BACL|nr:general stress protein [Paenibacillus baekrokdamisoli]MBB3070859.1 hypothetical protein [Paenibacillus baekrokdamisoli]BBH22203.1 hypothetical protein Back11_35480 [Paenibacillus baekrokdamisoli]